MGNLNAELSYQLYKAVRNYLEELESHKPPYVTPNYTHYTLLHLHEKYGKDVVQAEINEQIQNDCVDLKFGGNSREVV